MKNRVGERAVRRVWLIALIGVMTTALMLTGTPAQPAQAAGTGSISGTVTFPANTPAEWITHSTVIAETQDGSAVFATINPHTGAYSLQGLADGDYIVRFAANGFSEAESDNWVVPNLARPPKVSVTISGGGKQAGINATFTRGSSISGTVSLPAGSPPQWLEAVTVRAVRLGGDGTQPASVDVDLTTGGYSIVGLVAGTYTVHFGILDFWDFEAETTLVPNILRGNYNTSADINGITRIEVPSGTDIRGIDETLSAAATISGTVTLPPGLTLPRHNLWVSARSLVPSNSTAGSAPVDPSTGAYSVMGLDDGDYTVFFYSNAEIDRATNSYRSTNVLPEFYGGGRTKAEATVVSAARDAPQTNIDVTLDLGGTLNGSMNLAPGAEYRGITFVPANVDDTKNPWLRQNSYRDLAASDFTVTGLVPGEPYYAILHTGSVGNTVAQYAKSSPDSYLFTAPAAGATNTTALIGQPTTSKISGSVTVTGLERPFGPNVWAFAKVFAYQKLDTGWFLVPQEPQSVPSLGSNAYAFSGLTAGTYTIGFQDPYNPYGFWNTNATWHWWQGQLSLETATPINLVEGQTKAGVNGAIMPWTPPAAPSSITATTGNRQAAVSWTAPVNNGGSPITGYTVTASPGGRTATVAGTALTATITGLPNDVPYTFTVKATNAKGDSAASVASAAVTPGVSPFTDIIGKPFKSEIEWMYTQGITTGYPVAGGSFEYRPYGNVTRDAMAAFLYRAAGSPAFTAPATSPFVDVPKTHPFYKEITWLAASGISGGWDIGGGKKEYRPGLNITRDAMAVFLYRYAKITTFTPPATSPFVDVPTSNGFYKEIAWMASTGITTGYDLPGGKKEFRPFNPITRDAMAAFLFRFDALP